MSENYSEDRHACLHFGGRQPTTILLVAQRIRCILAAYTWTLLCCLTGCATSMPFSAKEHFDRGVDVVVRPFNPTYGTVSLKDLTPDYKPKRVRPSKTFDLARLGRPAEAETRIHIGDLLEVSCSDLVEESKKETFPVHVADDGTVSLPLLDQRVPIASLTEGEAEQVIHNAYAASNLIRQPQLTVRTLEHKTNTIYVIGAVKKPGVYELQPEECDPLRAIVAAGGVTEDAEGVVEIRRAGKRNSIKRDSSTRPENVTKVLPDAEKPRQGKLILLPEAEKPRQGKIVLVEEVAAKPRADDEILRFDLSSKNIARNPDQLQLQNGDIVSVEQKKIRPFYVAGAVNKPGEFPMPKDREIRALEAVGLAGGVLTISEPTTALVVRRPKGKEAVVIRIDLSRAARHPAENPILMEGDVISVVEDAAAHARRAVRQFINLGLSLPIRMF
jgi:protein involved in polysaccharide export with SLBB domain